VVEGGNLQSVAIAYYENLWPIIAEPVMDEARYAARRELAGARFLRDRH